MFWICYGSFFTTVDRIALQYVFLVPPEQDRFLPYEKHVATLIREALRSAPPMPWLERCYQCPLLSPSRDLWEDMHLCEVTKLLPRQLSSSVLEHRADFPWLSTVPPPTLTNPIMFWAECGSAVVSLRVLWSGWVDEPPIPCVEKLFVSTPTGSPHNCWPNVTFLWVRNSGHPQDTPPPWSMEPFPHLEMFTADHAMVITHWCSTLSTIHGDYLPPPPPEVHFSRLVHLSVSDQWYDCIVAHAATLEHLYLHGTREIHFHQPFPRLKQVYLTGSHRFTSPAPQLKIFIRHITTRQQVMDLSPDLPSVELHVSSQLTTFYEWINDYLPKTMKVTLLDTMSWHRLERHDDQWIGVIHFT